MWIAALTDRVAVQTYNECNAKTKTVLQFPQQTFDEYVICKVSRKTQGVAQPLHLAPQSDCNLVSACHQLTQTHCSCYCSSPSQEPQPVVIPPENHVLSWHWCWKCNLFSSWMHFTTCMFVGTSNHKSLHNVRLGTPQTRTCNENNTDNENNKNTDVSSKKDQQKFLRDTPVHHGRYLQGQDPSVFGEPYAIMIPTARIYAMVSPAASASRTSSHSNLRKFMWKNRMKQQRRTRSKH